jgi:hypothetical protein
LDSDDTRPAASLLPLLDQACRTPRGKRDRADDIEMAGFVSRSITEADERIYEELLLKPLGATRCCNNSRSKSCAVRNATTGSGNSSHRASDRGRAGSAVARRPEVGACLQGTGRQAAALASGPLREFRNMGGDVHHQPVPEARASGIQRARRALAPERLLKVCCRSPSY